MSFIVKVELPTHLSGLADISRQVDLVVEGTVTQRTVLDALEARYLMLTGTIRDHTTKARRPFLRFFACEQDISHTSPDTPLPTAVAEGRAPLLIIGSISGGSMQADKPMRPITLIGNYVQLVPLSPDHAMGLKEAVSDGELWKLWYTSAPHPDRMAAEIERRLTLQDQGSMLPFSVVDPVTEKLAGMTTYMNIDAATPRLEIGSTWYAQSVQRTPLNTEAKLLLLTHAFETLGCTAVEFRTHFLNYRSRQAIERLGAKLDGILRSHAYAANGTLRDTCVYSVIAAEWLTVKSHLRWLLEKPR